MLDFTEDLSKISQKLLDHYADCWKKILSSILMNPTRILLKKSNSRLVEAPIMAKPDWNREFEIMCDASDFVMGAVLGQKDEKVFKAIYYASKTFNEA